MRTRLLISLLLLGATCATAQAQLPPPCRATDQSISVVDVFNPSEPLGQQMLMLQLYNFGPTCTLDGVPEIEFSSTPHRADYAITHKYDAKLVPVVVDEGPADPVVLKNTESAQLRILWSAATQTTQKHTPACHPVDALQLALPGDRPLTEIVALQTHICGALHVSHFSWGWVRQSNILRASWAPDASPTDDVVFESAPGSVYGDHFNGLGISLRTTTGNFPLGADVVLEPHLKNISAPRDPVVGDYPYRWLSMRESNGHTVLYSLGAAPPSEAGQGEPVPHGKSITLPTLSLRELGLLPTRTGHVTFALTAEFWPNRTREDGSPDQDALAYAPTAVVSYRLLLNFTAPN